VFLIIPCSGLVFGPWATLGDLVMVRLLMECGHSRRSLFVRLHSSIFDSPLGTTRVMLERSPIRPYLIAPVLPLPCGRKRDGQHTTTSCHGFPDNGYRAFIGPPGQEFHVADIPTRACTCPKEDHPGPSPKKGRGSPEIDVFEAERNKTGGLGGIVSQSAQFAPFTHDYLYDNSTSDKHTIFTPEITVPNTYRGSAVCVTVSPLWVSRADHVEYRQQAVSSLSNVPDNMFEGSGQVFTKFGFEYRAEPSAREKGFITWMVNGNPSHRVGADAMGPDQGPDGSGVGRRIIPEEPMVCFGGCPLTHVYSSHLAGIGPQFGYVSGLANYRPHHYDISYGNVDRLRSDIPEKGTGEHWV